MRYLIILILLLLISCEYKERERAPRLEAGALVTHKLTGDTLIVRRYRNYNVVEVRSKNYELHRVKVAELEELDSRRRPRR